MKNGKSVTGRNWKDPFLAHGKGKTNEGELTSVFEIGTGWEDSVEETLRRCSGFCRIARMQLMAVNALVYAGTMLPDQQEPSKPDLGVQPFDLSNFVPVFRQAVQAADRALRARVGRDSVERRQGCGDGCTCVNSGVELTRREVFAGHTEIIPLEGSRVQATWRVTVQLQLYLGTCIKTEGYWF